MRSWFALPAAFLTPALLGAAPAAQTALPEASCPACLAYYRNAAGKTNLLDEVSLDREEESRTILLNTAEYDKLYLVIFYTYATATDIFVTLTCSASNAEYAPHSKEPLQSGGTNQRFLLSFDVRGCRSTKVVFSASDDASPSDVVTVQAVGQSSAKPETVLPVQ
jgi:hypothetical protein